MHKSPLVDKPTGRTATEAEKGFAFSFSASSMLARCSLSLLPLCVRV